MSCVLQKELSAKQEETATLQDELHAIKLDLETQKGQLFITKDTLQKLTKDKETIYQGKEEYLEPYPFISLKEYFVQPIEEW